MASKRSASRAYGLFRSLRNPEQHDSRLFARCMATEAPLPNATIAQIYLDAHLDSAPTDPMLKDQVSIPPPTHAPILHTVPQPYRPPPNPFIQTATCTTHAFPSMEPTSFVTYPSTHLLLPLRKDILHRAVIYEGDMTRQGTANTKWRSEVHGSNRKIRPQKGSGMARLGDKKSPMLRGGGVAFGPKPRDFSTRLPRKIYDLAWRTALSYRYKKGELLVVEDLAELEGVQPQSVERYLKEMLRHNRMGHADGRTLFVTLERRDTLFDALASERMGREARAVECGDVDVKDLLELSRVVVERIALEWMFAEHEHDLVPQERLGAWDRMIRRTQRAQLGAERAEGAQAVTVVEDESGLVGEEILDEQQQIEARSAGGDVLDRPSVAV